ncbi:hypothetical protein KJ693_05375 [bacterium]|nr:hypothetical protein [bacterium]
MFKKVTFSIFLILIGHTQPALARKDTGADTEKAVPIYLSNLDDNLANTMTGEKKQSKREKGEKREQKPNASPELISLILQINEINTKISSQEAIIKGIDALSRTPIEEYLLPLDELRGLTPYEEKYVKTLGVARMKAGILAELEKNAEKSGDKELVYHYQKQKQDLLNADAKITIERNDKQITFTVGEKQIYDPKKKGGKNQ